MNRKQQIDRLNNMADADIDYSDALGNGKSITLLIPHNPILKAVAAVIQPPLFPR